jgi:uncharacterized protein (TIGR02599 family)
MESGSRGARPGFTLVELLVAMVLLVFLMAVIFSIVNEVGRAWKTSTSKIEAFQDARAAFEAMTRRIGQATLNTYYDYFDATGKSASEPEYDGTPVRYGRQSELHFVTGKALLPGQIGHAIFFQSPGGQAGPGFEPLHSLLNAGGYFVQFGSDDTGSSLSGRPSFLSAQDIPLRHRFRLMEFSQPAEDLKVYDSAVAANGWFRVPLQKSPPEARVLAENVVALVILPKKPDHEEQEDDLAGKPRLGAAYEYDSRTSWSGTTQPASMNQLCPLVKVVMVTIDEASARRLQGDSTTAPDLGLGTLFQTAANLDTDLATLTQTLSAKHLNYRIFQTEIPLRAAKWN